LFGPIRGQTKNNKEYKRISTAALKAQKLGGKPSSIQLSILAKAKSGRRMGLFILLKCRVVGFNLHLKKNIFWKPTKFSFSNYLNGTKQTYQYLVPFPE